MNSMALESLGHSLRRFLHRPSRVFIVCLIFASVSMLFDGILWRLYGLHRDQDRTTTEIAGLKTEIKGLNSQLIQAHDPSFIERQARDRLDLAGENDLVFIFPEE